MVKWDIFEYLVEGKKRGFSDWVLKSHLVRNGFSEERVNEAFFQLNNEQKINRKKTFPALGTDPSFKPEIKKKKINLGLNEESSSKNVKKRNAALVFLLSIITLGVYAIYWLVSTSNELRGNSVKGPNSWFLLWFFVPLLALGGLVYYVSFISELSSNLIFGILAGAGLLFLVLHLAYFWKYSNAVKEVSGFSSDLLFILWIFLPPVAMIVSQVQINSYAKR